MIPKKIADTVVQRAGGACEVMVARSCTGRAEQLHHRKMRSQLGGHEVVNLLHICHVCHDWVHKHPALSYERGYLVRGARHEAFEPVLYRNARLFFLAPDGELVRGGKQ